MQAAIMRAGLNEMRSLAEDMYTALYHTKNSFLDWYTSFGG